MVGRRTLRSTEAMPSIARDVVRAPAPFPVDETPRQELVVVQRDLRDWHRAFVPLAAIEHVHWRRVAGARQPLLHAYIQCSPGLAGMLRHDCHAADAPHWLLVCILKRHTIPSIYTAMCARAGAS
jgi:hypothetical protein